MSEKKEPVAVKFEAEIRQVKSMVDHSVCVTLNLPEYSINEATWFLKKIGSSVSCVVVETV
jgi:hypothetical protein